ncbi:MAG: hypothetical protein ABWZ25_12255 [Chitinophagaceae bacterium]
MILKSTGVYLSVQTLGRILGLVHTDFRPSKNTLDTLAKYINYYSFADFQNLHEGESAIKTDKSNFISTFFSSLFSGINPSNQNTSVNIMQNVLKWMDSQPQFNIEIYSALSNTPYGRRHFFQEFVNVDSLNRGFGKGLQYYLLHTDDKQEKLQGYALSCFRYFLNDDPVKFANYFKCLQEYTPEEISRYHPSIIDRYFAAIIMGQSMADQTGAGPVRLLADQTSVSAFFSSKPNCAYYTGEALLLTGEFSKAWDIFKGCDIKNLHVLNESRADFSIQLRIFSLISGFLSGNITQKRAQILYDELSREKLPLLQTDYLTLFMLTLQLAVSQKTKLKRITWESFNQLIQKSKFKYFHNYYNKLEINRKSEPQQQSTDR